MKRSSVDLCCSKIDHPDRNISIIVANLQAKEHTITYTFLFFVDSVRGFFCHSRGLTGVVGDIVVVRL